MPTRLYRACGICGHRTLAINGICFECKRTLSEPEKPVAELDTSNAKHEGDPYCEHLNSVGQDEYDRYCFDCNRVLRNYDR